MPGQKKDVGLRSGRFKVNNSALPIIRVENVAQTSAYRIYNAGKTAITITVVELTSLNTTTTKSLAKNCSLDLQVPVNSMVKVTGPGQGVYDLIGTSDSVRSGRFQAPAGGAAFTLSQNPGLYRFTNAGDSESESSTQNDIMIGGFTIKGQCSVDQDVASSIDIAAGAANGVYDLLEPRTSVRSGRFHFEFEGSPTAKSLIRTTKTGVTRRYRIYNSGDNPITINVSDGASGSTSKVIRRDQSFDFQVSSTLNNHVTVVGAANSVVDGVYEYLGEVH